MKPLSIFLAVLVLLCCTCLAAAQETHTPRLQEHEEVIVAWLRQNALPIRHVEAGTGFADLQPLKHILRDVRIVGLGEATHGTREFFQFKHRLVEFLVTEMNFTIFALEASHSASQPINEYILHGKGDRATVLSGQGYVPWDTEEFSVMLDWMRDYNQRVPEERKVRFYGVDLAYNDLSRENVIRYLSRHSPARVPATRALFQTLAAEDPKWPMQIDENSRRVMADALPQLDGLIHHLTTDGERYIRRSSPTEYNQVLFQLGLVRQFARTVLDGNLRSPSMAQNVMHLMDHGRPDAKMVIWQHNWHVSTGADESPPRRMGYFLREKYGEQYYAFGFDFNQGTYLTRMLYPGQPSGELKESTVPPAPRGSLAWYLSRTNLADLLVDLRTTPVDPVVQQWLDTPLAIHAATWGYQDPSEIYVEERIRRHYDGVIFFERTTATRPTANALEAVSRRERF
jgi:erythromycin esterase